MDASASETTGVFVKRQHYQPIMHVEIIGFGGETGERRDGHPVSKHEIKLAGGLLVPISDNEARVVAMNPRDPFEGIASQQEVGIPESVYLSTIWYTMVIYDQKFVTADPFCHPFERGTTFMRNWLIQCEDGPLFKKYPACDVFRDMCSSSYPYPVLQFIS